MTEWLLIAKIISRSNKQWLLLCGKREMNLCEVLSSFSCIHMWQHAYNYTITLTVLSSNISINALSCWTFILIISASRIDVQAAVYIKRNRHPKQLNSNQFSLVLFFIFPPLLVIKVSIIHSFFLINSDQVVHRFISFVNLLRIQSTTIAPEYDFVSY